MEAVIALLFVAGFIIVAASTSTPVNESTKETGLESKELLQGIALGIDVNGVALEVLDRNGITATEKMNIIKGIIDSRLPASFESRIEIRQYDSNVVECKTGLSFEDCFTELGTFPATGQAVPEDRAVHHEKFMIVKKQPPAMCEIRAEAMSLEKELSIGNKSIEEIFPEIFFGETKVKNEAKGETLFFAENDLNIIFGASMTPSGDVECDETIRVDLNATVPDYGRLPADIVLVLDISGSMIDFMNFGKFGDGSFNSGTYNKDWMGCYNYGNYQTLMSYEATVENELAEITPSPEHRFGGIRIRLGNYSYSGDCSRPIVRLRFPDNSVEDDGSNAVTWTEMLPEGTYTVEGWSDDLINYDLNIDIPKLRIARIAAKTFVDLADWKSQDHIGLVSYSDTTATEEILTNDRNAIKDALDDLRTGGGTATGEGIYEATDELQEPSTGHGRAGAMSFQILLSDGQTNSGRSSSGAATDAASKDIIIYTIGFGEDADETELGNIASITGGEYYYAQDINILNDVYELIALQIGADLSQTEPEVAYDSNISIPIPEWAEVTDLGGGTIVEKADGNYLEFDIGLLNADNPWTGYFEINFPCNNENACATSQLTFPPDGTKFGYDDGDGIPQDLINFDENITVNFKYRDLAIKVNTAELIGDNMIKLDVNVWNNGWLSSNASYLDFYLHDPITGNFIKQETVNAFCAGKDPACSNYIQLFIDQDIGTEGFIYAIVNRDGAISECPNNNVVEIYCYGGSKTQYYLMELWIWRKGAE